MPIYPQPSAPQTADSASILRRFCRARDGVVRYAIEPAYLDLLKKLGDPHKKLPPVIHVAGTNGKGSVCAFLRAMLEAAGQRVHVYTSPHLVHFHERIRIAGELISEEELVEILEDCERLGDPGQVSDFEAATAAAFVAFAQHPADVAILEVGMGGRLDATNVIETSAASIITRLSYDHCKYLGESLTAIAREKAGIMRSGTPCFTALHPEDESLTALRTAATEKRVPLSIGGIEWRVELQGANGFRFIGAETLDLPLPSLIGPHQLWNAGLAIAALQSLPVAVPSEVIARGLQKAEWPARLQNITSGALVDLLPSGWDLWLDGGHNDSAGEALAEQMKIWCKEDINRPLYLIVGMLSTKDPRAFFVPMVSCVQALRAIEIPDEVLSFTACDLAAEADGADIKNAKPAPTLHDALMELAKQSVNGRILICGSLYLAGHVLRVNEWP